MYGHLSCLVAPHLAVGQPGMGTVRRRRRALQGKRTPSARSLPAITVSWGGTIHRAVGYALIFAGDAWCWWLLPPAAAIAALVVAFALIGWALDEAAEGR